MGSREWVSAEKTETLREKEENISSTTSTFLFLFKMCTKFFYVKDVTHGYF